MAALREAARRGSADTSTTAEGGDLAGAEQSSQQMCAGLDEAEMGGSEHELYTGLEVSSQSWVEQKPRYGTSWRP